LREDTATLVSPDPADPVLGLAPRLGDITPAAYNTQVSNPKALNAALAAGITDADGTMIFTRAPQVAKIKLAHPNGTSTVLYCIANHFSSGPDRRVEQRRAQAGFLVRLASAIQATDKNARIVIAGDLNVYPRPDDPFTPATRSAPSDQLGALYDAGFFNLFDVLVREVPAAAYSYLYQGQAQTLDHIFLSRSQRADLQQVRVAHINADWPGGEAIQQGEFMRGASDHDPCIAVFSDTPRTAPDNMDDERPGTARWPQGPLPVSWPLGALDSPNILVAAVPAPMPSPVQPVSLTPVVSPAQPSFLPQPGPSRPAVIFNAKLDLNNATELQLLTLPGIGPSRARSILAYRQQNGPFKAVGDLAKVPNIGPKTLERIVSLLMVK
jgi:competence ComEA-like helix-hairpin-helix protein